MSLGTVNCAWTIMIMECTGLYSKSTQRYVSVCVALIEINEEYNQAIRT